MHDTLKEHLELLVLEDELRILQGVLKDLRTAAAEAPTETQRNMWLAEEPGMMARITDLETSLAALRDHIACQNQN